MKNALKKIEDFSLLIDAMGDLVRVIRPDCTIALVNDAMREQFGDHIDEFCYKTMGKDHACEDCVMRRMLNGDNRIFVEREINGASYSIKASPLYDSEGELLGCLEVYRDITEEVHMRERLMRANAKMLEDLSMAQGLQKAIFRKNLPNVDGYKFSMGFYPCDAVGGDACDCIILKDGKVLFYVADVSGHGVRAAMLTVFLRQEILMNVKGMTKLRLEEMMESIRESFMELNADEATYITMFMVLLDPKMGECAYINAGHSVAPVVKINDSLHELYLPGPPVCRWSEHAGSAVRRIRLGKGDRIAVFTDGVMEKCDGIDVEHFFKERFLNVHFDAADFIHDINEIHNGNRIDDILLMVCERTA